jgi:hypothetical protein
MFVLYHSASSANTPMGRTAWWPVSIAAAKLRGGYYVTRGGKVVMNGCPATEIDDHRRWAAAGYPAVAPQNLLDSDIAFIFNEAQQSYWGQGLWLGFIKPQSGMPGGARMCLFSSFGSPSSGALPETFPTGSPVGDKIF